MAENKANRESRAKLCGKPGPKDALGPGTRTHPSAFSFSLELSISGNFSSLLRVYHLHKSWKLPPVKPEPWKDHFLHL